MNEKYITTINNRQEEEKQKILGILEETPIVAFACRKTGISRSTYYRWQEDESFKNKLNEAMREGVAFINDMSESKLIKMIDEEKLPAITLWLKHRHPAYGGKIEKVNLHTEVTTPEQEEIIRKAMESITFPSTMSLMISPGNLCQTS